MTTTDQRERFEQTARELGVELDEEKLKADLRKIAPKQPQEKRPPTNPVSEAERES